MQRAKYKTALGLASLLALGSAGTISSSNEKPNSIQEPIILDRNENDSKDFLKSLGMDVAQQMNIKGDFDYVDSELLDHFDRIEKVHFYDILIRGYKTDGDASIVECSINLDNMCYEYTKGIPVFRYLVGQKVYVFPSTGELVTCKVKPKAAEALDFIFTEYIKRNNTQRCVDYIRHVKNNRKLSGGPRDRSK